MICSVVECVCVLTMLVLREIIVFKVLMQHSTPVAGVMLFLVLRTIVLHSILKTLKIWRIFYNSSDFAQWENHFEKQIGAERED